MDELLQAIIRSCRQAIVIIVAWAHLREQMVRRFWPLQWRWPKAQSPKFMVLHTAAGRVGAMDIGATTDGGMMRCDAAEVIYNLGADEVDILRVRL